MLCINLFIYIQIVVRNVLEYANYLQGQTCVTGLVGRVVLGATVCPRALRAMPTSARAGKTRRLMMAAKSAPELNNLIFPKIICFII